MNTEPDWPPRDPDNYSSRKLSSIGGTITGFFSDLETGGHSWVSYLLGLLVAGAVVFLIGYLVITLAS